MVSMWIVVKQFYQLNLSYGMIEWRLLKSFSNWVVDLDRCGTFLALTA